MESKPQASTLSTIFLLLLLGFASSDINQDKAECSNQVTGLAPCLPYVESQAKAPTVDCCSGLKQVVDNSKKCLCLLIKDIDDPSLGLNINATFAAALPATCGVTVNMTDCISLLHLAPNSQEAKLFEAYQKLTKGSPGVATTSPSTTGNSTTSSGAQKSDGRKRQKWASIEVALGVSIWIFIIHQNFGVS
ncbi:glycosylphosphatidylinositol-anchored lipid protein transfer 6 [Hibiscus trionum]|uniref:Glycosylphosphatidylinositol-anchored lipid protein transfer 6 n=1 Tax=Hibiscus trionum TaxID=183268 RepID=A0A9W7HC02_HIBTR|nr:glycosylphosphatidylinositol-anchored lipid protein transfer 6 [Hibiscus trionum]